MTAPDDIGDKLLSLLGQRPLSLQPMEGATSSDLYLVSMPDGKLVLRLFKEERWESSAESLTAREAQILTAVAGSAIQTPALIGCLPDNGVLMSWLSGRVVLPSAPAIEWLDELARQLTLIHQTSVTLPYGYESWNDTDDEKPAWWQDVDSWQAARRLTAQAPEFDPILIHRDYHPVNVLWENDRISGVVDWINACMGPAGVDVAHCRSNLALMYGMAIADEFLALYKSQNPEYLHDPYWDLDDALGALPDVSPYPPWGTFGLGGLSTGLMRDRLQSYVRSCVSTHPEK
jgi:Ser/Thr protein kinase RdoA (MazF antagonist)